MTNELGKIRKEAGVACFKVTLQQFPPGTDGNSVKPVAIVGTSLVQSGDSDVQMSFEANLFRSAKSVNESQSVLTTMARGYDHRFYRSRMTGRV
jgi:hypothetical protein